MSDNGCRADGGSAAVFTLRWPFKTVPCFHWHSDVRALKDSSLSSANGEGNGPGKASCFRRETFALHKSQGNTRRWNEPELSGARRGLKTKLLRWLWTWKSSARSSTLTAAAATTNGPSTAKQLLVDARPLLKNMLQPSRLNPGSSHKFPVC